MQPSAGGDALVLAAAAVATGLARGRPAEDVAILSAFLTVVADQLALLSALQAGRESHAPGGGALSPGPSR